MEEQGGDSLANDWRTQHEPGLRKRVIFAIVEKLKRGFYHLSESDIKNQAIRFEDKIYGMAKDKDDYLLRLKRKIIRYHRKFRTVFSANIGGSPQVHLPPAQIHQTALQSQSGQVHVSQSLDSVQMRSSHQNGASSSVCGITTSQTTSPGMEPEDERNNTMSTSAQEHSLFTLPPEPLSERPIDRLIKAIQSSSPESLAQSVSEMRSVISLTDRLSGSVHSTEGSRARFAEDLSARTRFRVHQGDTNPTKRFKRSVTTMPSPTDSYEQFSSLESEVDSTASSTSKVNKNEPSCALLQEITEINGKLIETVVRICSEDVCPSEVTSGTVVTCSYVPVALSASFKALYKSGHISQIQPLCLLVPENYPHSQITLEKVLFDASEHKNEDLSARARSRFGLSMGKYLEGMSLKEIAKVWDECARATMAEYAERNGGGTFSSKYGRWESVLRAS